MSRHIAHLAENFLPNTIYPNDLQKLVKVEKYEPIGVVFVNPLGYYIVVKTIFDASKKNGPVVIAVTTGPMNPPQTHAIEWRDCSMIILPDELRDVNCPATSELEALAAEYAADDAALALWLDANADDLAGESEALDRATSGLLF